MDDNKKEGNWVGRKCLVCGMSKKIKEGRKDYLRIQVCPNCKGAFVDIFYLGLYEKI